MIRLPGGSHFLVSMKRTSSIDSQRRHGWNSLNNAPARRDTVLAHLIRCRRPGYSADDRDIARRPGCVNHLLGKGRVQPMKLIQCLLGLLALVAIGCSQQGGPVGPRAATTLDPEEIGIKKFLFEANPAIGDVMTIRCTQSIDFEKQGKTQETVQSTNGGLARQVVLVYDSMSFPFGERKEGTVLVRYPGGEHNLSKSRLVGTASIPGRLTLDFENADKVRTTWTFVGFTEAYKEAKARIASLPPLSANETWTYSAVLEQ